MISRDLSRRIERLERQLRPRIKDRKASAAMIPLQRLNQARRRLALEGDERYAAYRDLAPEPDLYGNPLANEIVERLKAARIRAAAAATEKSNITGA